MVNITSKGSFGFDKMLQQLQGPFKRSITEKVAAHILLFFRLQFQKQGTEKDGFVKWKERKFKVNRKVLVKTGYLRDSMKITSKRFELIKVEVEAPYAKYHQEGTDKLPKREMLYPSKTLEDQVTKIIRSELRKILKK